MMLTSQVFANQRELHLKITYFQPSQRWFQVPDAIKQSSSRHPSFISLLEAENSLQLVLPAPVWYSVFFHNFWCASQSHGVLLPGYSFTWNNQSFHAAVTREMEALQEQYLQILQQILAARNSVPPLPPPTLLSKDCTRPVPLGGVTWQHAAQFQ